MCKSHFQGKELKIIVYGQYLLIYEIPIKENASRLARRHADAVCQSLEHHKFSFTFTAADFFTQLYLLLKFSKYKIQCV